MIMKVRKDVEEKKSIRFSPIAITKFQSLAKGQLILECPFAVFISSKKPTKIFPGFLP